MAEFVQKQPNRGRPDDGFVPDANEANTGPQLGGGDATRGRLGGVSAGAGGTLGNIDDVLNDNAGATRGGVSNTAARAAKNRRAGVGVPNRTTTRRTPGGGAGEAAAAGGAMSAGKLSDKEENAMIGGFYKAAGVKQEGDGPGGNKLTTRLKGINRRRKIAAAGGVGGIAGLMMAALLITPIYRIPAFMSDLEGKIGKEVGDIVEARAERMILLYLIGKAGGNPTNYVLTGSPLHDIWRTFQSRKIEKKIFDQAGIRFYKGADGLVHIEHDGRDLGRLRPGTNAYAQAQAIIARGTIETKKDFKIILRTVLPALRFHKASVEAEAFKVRFLKRIFFGAPRPPPAAAEPGLTEAQQAAAAAQAAVEALTAQQVDQGIANGVEVLGDAFDCVLEGSNCESFEEQDEESRVPDPDSEEAQRNRDNGSADEVNRQVSEAADEARDEAIQDRRGGFVSRMFEKMIAKIVGAVIAKSITGAIPYIGWIDLAALLQHAIGTAIDKHLLTRIPIMIKEGLYGAIFSSWEGYAHQAKRGTMPLSQLSALSDQISGAEKAQSYKLVYGGKDGGIKIDPPVGSDKNDKSGDILDFAYNNWFNRWVIRGILEAWYYTVGKLIKFVADLGGDLVIWLFEVTGFTALMNSTMEAIFGDNWKEELAKFAMNAIMWLFGITIDPLARGAQMFNNIFAGAAVALNYHCRFNLGCRTITEKEESWFGLYFEKKEREEMAMTSMKDRLFDIDNPKSLTSTLVREAPANSSPGTVMASLFGHVAQLPQSVFTALSPKVRAASFQEYSKAAGVQWYGAFPGDLDADISPEVRQQQAGNVTCPKTNPTEQFNACQADVNVVKGLVCIVQDCPEWGPPDSETQ
jgi:hypothetical protein